VRIVETDWEILLFFLLFAVVSRCAFSAVALARGAARRLPVHIDGEGGMRARLRGPPSERGGERATDGAGENSLVTAGLLLLLSSQLATAAPPTIDSALSSAVASSCGDVELELERERE